LFCAPLYNSSSCCCELILMILPIHSQVPRPQSLSSLI
jgi:hypothetical protein